MSTGLFLLSVEVALRIVPYGIEDERFAEEHLDLVVSPILRGQRLQEHDNALTVGRQDARAMNRSIAAHLKVHLPQFFAPFDEKGRAHVKVELGERLRAFRLDGSKAH